MEYDFRKIEKYWQQKWSDDHAYKVSNDSPKPKYYVLDMFPYPSGAGLHVGHPLGYIASDIYARYKRLKGFNVLHPMGYDAFGLPAEQYAIENGVHPAVSTKKNIENFRSQLDKIGFSFDWSREVNTSDPQYYKWTQWIFLQLFKSYFNRKNNKAESIESLIKTFEQEGNIYHPIPNSQFQIKPSEGSHQKSEIRNQTPINNPQSAIFNKEQWKTFDEKQQQDILMEYRLAYCGIGEVNWCEGLGTVLANDEVVNGVSERGGFPVVKKKLRQWYLRITEYADRLLEGLQTVDFSEAMKEMQGNWIGKSFGAEIKFDLIPNPSPEGEGSLEHRRSIKTVDSYYWNILKEYARENRKNQTEAEDILWQRLRNNQLNSKVRRQQAIGGFIVDFAFLNANLVIEIDGEYHSEAQQKKYDEAREEYLKEYGYYILRFTNDEVINDTENIVRKIETAIKTFTPVPLLREEKGLGVEASLTVYTTRPDTIFGVDFMVIAPEHELIKSITTTNQQQAVDEYITYVKSRSDRERQAEKKITGCFTGAYVINPFNQKEIPVWISEYVLAGYGTGAIMAVPCGDERDFKFAKHFNIPITNIIGKNFNGEEANPTKDALLENSEFLNGMVMRDAIKVVNDKLEELGIGKKKVNYKMRDAAFSRQRYWGEPFPIVWKNGIAYPLNENELPLQLPHVESYKPGPEGEGPLANIDSWFSLHSPDGEGPGMRRETNTMPGYAGSSWYFLRYMDPHNNNEFCNKKASDYWNQVDVYVGGTEHAVGHLLYSRMWTKALYDLGFISFDEPFRKLVNQGMIQGSSRFINRLDYKWQGDISQEFQDKNKFSIFVSSSIIEEFKLDEFKTLNSILSNLKSFEGKVTQELFSSFNLSSFHVDVNIVDGLELDIEAFKKWRNGEYADAQFILEDGKYICGVETEKMSKSKFNTVNPNDLVEKYGADTFRMYEMFLGPVEQSKPWDTKGIEGVHRFLKKLWRLFYDDTTPLATKWRGVGGEAPTNAEYKILHRAIKKIEDDTDRFSFNTAVSAFMVCVNELSDVKCNKKEILEAVLILLTPYAPHIAAQLWHALGNEGSVLDATYPTFESKYLVESSKEYPVSVNGKLRTQIVLALDISQPEVEKIVLENDTVQKWLEGKTPKKIIFVKNKMVNVVI